MSGIDVEIFFCTPVNDPTVLKKVINNAKAKTKLSGLQYDASCSQLTGRMEQPTELELRKQEWQEELDSMSDFLLLKSTEEQKDEGIDTPVDTAFIADRDGLPVLRAIFDVHYFTPEEVYLSVKDDQLVLEACCLDDRSDRVYRKTMNRRIDLPKHVYPHLMHCQLSETGILTIEMPFHLPPQRKPQGPNVYPIIVDKDGSRKIRLGFNIGKEFTIDDIKVEKKSPHCLAIIASYDAELGKYGTGCNKRELRNDYILPRNLEVDAVKYSLSPDGKLYMELLLKDDKQYKCQVTTVDIS